jgi:hypothetical protein
MKPATIIHEFVIQKAANEPLAVQVKLYRALALLVASEHQAATLTQLADELSAASRTQQLLSFATDFEKPLPGDETTGKDGHA